MSAFAFCPLCGAVLEDRTIDGVARRGCTKCAFIHFDNPTPVVAAIVEHGDSVVLVRSHGWPETWFGLVTGFLERGESAEDGVLREVREELGLTGKIVRLVGVYPFFQMNQIIIAYHVTAEGEIAMGAELAAFKRVVMEKLRPWPSGTGQALAEWLAARNGR
jgi:NADH pyrophosphatase NudC (nudix superfamily)